MIMQDQNVSIDQSVAVINGITYPVRAISSIQIIQQRMPPQKQIGIFAGGIGLMCIFMSHGDFGVIAFGAVLAIIGTAMTIKARDYFYLKLMTNAGERRVLGSKDGIYISAVRDSLVTAVSMASQE